MQITFKNLKSANSLSSRPSLGRQPQRHVRTVVYAASQNNSNPSNRGRDLDFPIFEKAVKEPVSFLGGIFAGFLALDLTQDPLKSWIDARAAETGLAYQAAKGRLRKQQKQSSDTSSTSS